MEVYVHNVIVGKIVCALVSILLKPPKNDFAHTLGSISGCVKGVMFHQRAPRLFK
jgi:hypothetical protein